MTASRWLRPRPAPPIRQAPPLQASPTTTPPGQQRIEAAAHQAGDATDAAVHEPGDAGGRLLRHRAQRSRHAHDVVVQVLDQAGQAQRGVHGQSAGTAQVAGDRVGGGSWQRRFSSVMPASCLHPLARGPPHSHQPPAVPRSRRRCSPVRPAVLRCVPPRPVGAGAGAGADRRRPAAATPMRVSKACSAPLALAGTVTLRQAAGGAQVRVVEHSLVA